MNQKSGTDALREVCRRGTIDRVLARYIKTCRPEVGDTAEDGTKRRTANKIQGRFPNLAGFCRHQGIGLEGLRALAEEFPEQIERLYVTLEDEALNGGLPPPILSAYLKKRLGYDRDEAGSTEEAPTVRFEHDIFSDGE